MKKRVKKKVVVGVIILLFLLIAIYLAITLFNNKGNTQTCSQNTDCPENFKCENFKCVDVGCVGEGALTPGSIAPDYYFHMANQCCNGLEALQWNETLPGCEEMPTGGGHLCTAKCGDGICNSPKEGKCTCPVDCH
jgi:hypothetical protein